MDLSEGRLHSRPVLHKGSQAPDEAKRIRDDFKGMLEKRLKEHSH